MSLRQERWGGGCYRRSVLLILVSGLWMAGCRFTMRKLPAPTAPAIVRTATADDLVRELNERWSALNSMYANVEIVASSKNRKGKLQTHTPFPATILMRKPEMLRVYGRVPVLGTQLFGMATDGDRFTLYIPSLGVAYTGSNELKTKSSSEIENLRPGFFFDALVIRGLAPDDFYTQANDLELVETADRKHLISMPEYVLTVTQRGAENHHEAPRRVVTFHRDDLLPYKQDLYDKDGDLETEISYEQYADFDGCRFPSVIRIARPLESRELLLTVEKMKENPESPKLTDDQFKISLPEGTRIHKLD